MDLFTTSYEERRNAFVRRRLGEPRCLGREDIEEWIQTKWAILMGTRFGVGHTGVTTAERDYLFQTALSCKRLQDQAAECSEMILSDFIWSSPLISADVTPDTWQRILSSFRPDEVEFSFFHDREDVFIRFNSDGKTLYMNRRGVWAHSPSPTHIVLALIDSWKMGDRGPAQHLLRLFEVVARFHRSEAEASFNRAVAVSEDGRRIVCADQVFVLVGQTWLAFTPEEFQGAKIRLTSECDTFKSGFDSNQAAQMRIAFVSEWGKGPEFRLTTTTLYRPDTRWLTQAVVRTFDDKTFFLTTASHCPDPLPEGSIPIV